MTLETEALYSLSRACHFVPGGSTPSTLLRWIAAGKLEAVRGRRAAWYTSREAIWRYLRGVTGPTLPHPGVGAAALRAALRSGRRSRSAGSPAKASPA